MNITFIGHSSCIPDVGHEMACFLINGKHLVDTGWCAVLKMREFGFDPLDMESIIITHFHQDHYIGLPQLLFYIGLRGEKQGRVAPLNIAGPADHLERVVKAAEEFQQIERFPELKVSYRLIPIVPGEHFELEELQFDTCAASHVSGHQRSEQAIVYKVTEKSSGACVAFTGDTHYHPAIAEFVKRVPLLIHDGSHTPPDKAAEIAKAAEVGRLMLIHYSRSSAHEKLASAREVFPKTDLAEEGSTVEVKP